MKRKLVVAGSIGLAAVVIVSVVQFKNTHASQKVLQTMMMSEPVTMNPVMTTDIYSGQAQDQVYESFYRYDGDKIVPAMATQIVKPSENDTVYTFKIRQNAKWSNGDPVTAQDFITAIQKMADPRTKSQASADGIAVMKNYDAVHKGTMSPDQIGAKALDQRTVQITLTKPVPWFNQLATTILPVDTKKYQLWGDKYGTASNYMVTNSAYQMLGWTGTNTSFTFEKNPYYWHADHVRIAKVKTRVIKTPMTAAGEFKNQHLDIAQLSDNYIATYKKQSNYHAVPQAIVRGLYFNETASKTNSQNLRQAFGYLINRDEITQSVMKDGSLPQSNAVPQGVMKNASTGQDFTDNAGVQFRMNKQKAKAAWATYLKETGQHEVNLSMTFDNDPTSKAVGEYIQYTAEHAFPGLTVNTKYEPHNQVVSDVLKQNFDLVNIGLSVSIADASFPLKIGQTGYGLNFSKVSDPTYDQLLTQANDMVTDPTKRYQLLQAANQYFTQTKAYMVPLYQPITANVVAKRVGGFRANAFHTANYQDMYWQ